ncbi:MAG: class I SAM-dependent methyltransferase, partial [Actinobacteria bacterium]|nr:class I SAM-dependent methyltransferase [Actinomycetota bacterium]
MRPGSLDPYEQALMQGTRLAMVTGNGERIELNVDRFLTTVDVGDRTVLERCRGAVLDVGCGPGRFVSELCRRGQLSLGVDAAATAVFLARRRGAPAVYQDVFRTVPREGLWDTVLLMDGNIGIGGDVTRLLGRCDSILTRRGRVIAEAASSASCDRVLQMRFDSDDGPVGPSFDWAEV